MYALQDPVLRLLARELDREARLRRLAAEGLRRLLDVEVARELLRDRRPALHDVAGANVREERAHDAGVVERAVRQKRRSSIATVAFGTQLLICVEIDRLPVLLRGDRAEERAVRRVDERVLPDARPA